LRIGKVKAWSVVPGHSRKQKTRPQGRVFQTLL
jgi:hypothetical protein